MNDREIPLHRSDLEDDSAVIGEHQPDASDDWQTAHRTFAVPHSRPPTRTATGSHPASRAELDAGARRSAPHRPGRGGFDPEHAAATAAYRFRRRRLVTLVLVLLTGGLVAGWQLIDPRLGIGAVITGVVLIGYLTYLNRTVRVERAIAERRMARLRRAREIRPAAVHQAPARSPYRPEETTHPHEAADRLVASSRVPGASRRAGVVVDLDDDDPAFDDLEYYEPVVYRRAAGQ